MTQFHDQEYLDLVEHIIINGKWKQNRTGTKTKSIFGPQLRFDLSDGTIPLLTTKRMHVRSILHEILWYLQGDGNIKYLHDHNVTIWDEWATPSGDLGPVYGVQWRKWNTGQMKWIRSDTQEPITIDQIAVLVDQLKNNPDSRRMLVTAWNVADLADESISPIENAENGKMALPPCHYTFQCYVADGRLSMILNQRSCDVGLGLPFNIVQYSILLRMLAEVTDLKPGEFIWNGGDVHIYENHLRRLAEQVHREPFPSPILTFKRKVTDIDDFDFDDFMISGYESHPNIKLDVAV
ncbi:MAG: thymidylate synthase [Methylotenera sp.]|nr:MAG: thymidylate synthase [Methylotenera sp.]